MTVLYYESELKAIVADIKDYINQSDDTIEQKNAYFAELEANKDDFEGLVNSGVFHDGYGKTINVFEQFGELCAEVSTEY